MSKSSSVSPSQRRIAAALALGVLAALALIAPGLASADVTPLGLNCPASVNGAPRFCQGGYKAANPVPPQPAVDKRVPSFDGAPLDVDVTLPGVGSGPFPTIVMLHGYGGNKGAFETSTPEGDGNVTYHYNNLYFAQRGYAVINYTARGFGDSCGSKNFLMTTSCATSRGYIHLKDRAYEARDTQTLLGKLVDQGIAKPDALGATGISYGGGESIELALLHDKMATRPDSFGATAPSKETLMPWKSPGGIALSLAAAWPRWPWSDLVYSLVPNGHFLDFDNSTNGASRSPVGVPIQTYIEGLYASGLASGTYAQPGTDPSADITNWHNRIVGGDPFTDPFSQQIVDEIYGHHQGYGALDAPGATSSPAPLLIENGWTDDLFPPAEALRIYNDLRRRNPGADVALQFGDLGHSRGQNKKNTNVLFNDQGSSFFDSHLKGAADPAPPAKGSVTTFTQTCPSDAPAGGPYGAASWPAVHPGAFRFGDQDLKASQTVTSAGGNPQTGKTIDPIAGGGACATVVDETAPGTAVYRAKSGGFTLLGLPTVTAKVSVTGMSPQLDSRLWDIAPDGNQTLISRGAYRLSTQDISGGKVTFQLHGNGWRFATGHTAKLELLGKDEPYLQPNKEAFQIAISNVVVELPVLEPPTSTEPFSNPPPGTTPATGSPGGGVIVAPALGEGKPLPQALRSLHLAVTPTRVRVGRRTRLRFTVTTRFHGRIYRVARVAVRVAGHKVSTNSQGRGSLVLRFRSAGRRALRADARTYRGDRRYITVVRPHRR